MQELRRFTSARVGLGRAGNSLPTRALLEFQLAQARARDAVHFPFDPGVVVRKIEAEGWPVIAVKSAARDHAEFLRRPDLGRRLDAESKSRIEDLHRSHDVVFIVADGLSAPAVHRQAVEVLRETRWRLDQGAWNIAPVVVVERGRVALSDEIGASLGASLAVMLIGERPGLSSPDSLGVYLTWAPRLGKTDAERNCISNIRPEGLSASAAAELLVMLMNASRARRISGVELKLDGPPERRFQPE
jgi:ethanolamine ammonia-lyase small subunit